jgi:hypothetical protein
LKLIKKTPLYTQAAEMAFSKYGACRKNHEVVASYAGTSLKVTLKTAL